MRPTWLLVPTLNCDVILQPKNPVRGETGGEWAGGEGGPWRYRFSRRLPPIGSDGEYGEIRGREGARDCQSDRQGSTVSLSELASSLGYLYETRSTFVDLVSAEQRKGGFFCAFFPLLCTTPYLWHHRPSSCIIYPLRCTLKVLPWSSLPPLLPFAIATEDQPTTPPPPSDSLLLPSLHLYHSHLPSEVHFMALPSYHFL